MGSAIARIFFTQDPQNAVQFLIKYLAKDVDKAAKINHQKTVVDLFALYPNSVSGLTCEGLSEEVMTIIRLLENQKEKTRFLSMNGTTPILAHHGQAAEVMNIIEMLENPKDRIAILSSEGTFLKMAQRGFGELFTLLLNKAEQEEARQNFSAMCLGNPSPV